MQSNKSIIDSAASLNGGSSFSNGTYPSSHYLSSTEIDTDNTRASGKVFDQGWTVHSLKSLTHNVRAVRAF